MAKVDKERLLNTWVKTGSNASTPPATLDNLISDLTELRESTKVLKTGTDEATIYTVKGVTGEGISFFAHGPQGTEYDSLSLRKLFDEHGAFSGIIEEMRKEFQMLFKYGDGVFFTTKSVLKTLCQRGGQNTIGKADTLDNETARYLRDAKYVNYMQLCPEKCSVVFRQQGNCKKVFAIMTDRYKLLPQDELVAQTVSAFEAEMGKPELVYYRIDNFMTDIQIDFPEKAKDFSQTYSLPDTFTPGIRIHLSDVGDASFFVYGTLRMGKALMYVPTARYQKKHTKKSSMTKIDAALKDSVFVEYTKVPERMVELLTVDVKNPWLTIESVAEKIGIKNALGSETAAKRIVEQLQLQVNGTMSYTAYDIAKLFLEAGADLEKPEYSSSTLTKLRSSFVQAVFYKY